MPDMLVRLYEMPEIINYTEGLEENIKIKKAMAPDYAKILEFIKTNFSEGWANECTKAFYNNPVSCYIAVCEKKITGFACYDATALGYFGPVGVLESMRGEGIGKALTLCCLNSMREKGYGYAVIGWVGPAEFYSKICGATIIEAKNHGVYQNMIGVD